MANKNAEKKFHYLYKTTNLLNNKYYYGMHSTNKLDDGYLGSGTYLNRSIKKYGKENFKKEIISYYNSREELVNAEIELITESVVSKKSCMNLKPGGLGGLGGMITIKDKDGLSFNVFIDDPRYLSGELVGVSKGLVTVKDKDGLYFSVSKNDPRYLSGELVHNSKGFVTVKDKDGLSFSVSKNDPRYLSGELSGIKKNMLSLKDKDGNTYCVSKDDSRYLSGELFGTFKGKTHTTETKEKISESNKGKKIGDKNGSFGTCWITKNNKNKKIKKDLLNKYIIDGWNKGRKM